MAKRWLVAIVLLVGLLVWFLLDHVQEAEFSAASSPSNSAPQSIVSAPDSHTATPFAKQEDDAPLPPTGPDIPLAQKASIAAPMAKSVNIADPISVQGRQQLRLRATAIRQANARALAELSTDVVTLLAELKMAEAQALLERFAARKLTAADRMLARMAQRKQKLMPCLPDTEPAADSIPVLRRADHDQQLREALRYVSPEVATALVGSEPIFEWQNVIAACAALTIDAEASLRRIYASAFLGDDEDRLFLQRFDLDRYNTLPPRPLTADGEVKPAYGRAELNELANFIQWPWNWPEKTQSFALAAESHPSLYGRYGEYLYFGGGPIKEPPDPERGWRYLELASERGELRGLRTRGAVMQAQADTAFEGYVLGLFARHLNARGCFPAEYLREWQRSYQYVEPFAQNMSPVTIELAMEASKRYIAEHGPAAYARYQCD